MFKVPIRGEINEKPINVFLGRRYKITTTNKTFEGTVTKCENESFLIKTINGGFVVDFESINNIETI